MTVVLRVSRNRLKYPDQVWLGVQASHSLPIYQLLHHATSTPICQDKFLPLSRDIDGNMKDHALIHLRYEALFRSAFKVDILPVNLKGIRLETSATRPGAGVTGRPREAGG